jgi:hypothetical protein
MRLAGASETLEDAAESGFGFVPDAAGGLGDPHALLRSLAASCIERTRYSIDGTPTRSLNLLAKMRTAGAVKVPISATS